LIENVIAAINFKFLSRGKDPGTGGVREGQRGNEQCTDVDGTSTLAAPSS